MAGVTSAGDAAIQQGDGQIRGRDDGQECQDGEPRGSHAGRPGRQQRQGKHGGAEDGDRSQIAGRREADVQAKQPAQRRRPVAERHLDSPAPVADEVEAGISPPVVPGAARAVRLRHGLARDVQLGAARASRELLDRVPVGVAGREVHRA